MIKASEEVVASHSSLIDELSWQTISTGIRCDRNIRQGTDKTLCPRCWMEHIPFVQAVPLNDSVTSLAISILPEGDDTYITGVNLMDDSGESRLTLGYWMPGMTAIVNLGEKRLKGFNIVSGEVGIHAMRAIFDDLTYSNWAGQEEGDTFQSRELLLDRSIQAFAAKFDVSQLDLGTENNLC